MSFIILAGPICFIFFIIGPLKVIEHTPKVQTHFQFVTSDSKNLFYASNAIDPESYALYRYNFLTQKKELVFSEKGLWSITDFKDNGDMILTKTTGSLWSEHYFWNLSEKKLIPIIGQNEHEEYSVAFSKTENEYIVLTPKLGDFRRLYLLKKGNLLPITSETKMDVTDFFLDFKKERLYYTVNDGGYFRGNILSANNFKLIPFQKIKNADETTFGRATNDGRYLTVSVMTAKAPRTSYVFDWKTKKLVQWAIPSAPEIDLNHYVVAKLEYYPARDGTMIPMFVRRSPECEKKSCPVIVKFHGGPESQSTPGFSPQAQLFVDAGFIYVEPNVRGSDGYGKAWINSDNGAKRESVITDIEDCARFIRSTWKKEGKEPKIGITGGSYGGYSTLIGMTMFAGAYDAGASNVGMSNLVSFLQNTAPYRRTLRMTEYGDLNKDLESLKKLSPINYIDQIRGPLLIIQGVNDPRVPAGEAVQIYEVMKKKGLDSNLILFPDEGHGASKRSNQVLQIGHILQFFNKHLK